MLRDMRALFSVLVLASFAFTGCLDDVEPMPDRAEADGEPPEPEAQPDPEYRRTCQARDFDCTGEECTGAGTDGPLGCFKPCDPASLDAVGGRHPDCDEPQRPFCSEVGLWQGGDYTCNGCVYLCTAEPEGPACERSALACW